jgi:ribosomal-protein-alanine N-acetyltransferase
VIRGELTNLRAIEPADAHLIWIWFNDPELMRYWGLSDPSESRDSIRSRIERWLEVESIWGRPVAFIIERIEGDAIGLVVLSNEQPVDASAEISILIADSSCRGQGYGGDALEAVVHAAFESWNLHRLTARVEAFNGRAREFFEDHSFAREGCLKEARFMEGSYHDILVYGRLNRRKGE